MFVHGKALNAVSVRQNGRVVCLAERPRGSGGTARIKPAWAGTDELLSKLTNLLIQTPWVYRILKKQAKAVMVRTAASRGIDWSGCAAALEEAGVSKYFAPRTDLVYPAYYTKPFHAYDEGNLCWLAAYEVEPATYAMALRVWPQERELSWRDAQRRLRHCFLDQVTRFMADPGDLRIDRVRFTLDVGCGAGISTRFLAEYLARNIPRDDALRVLGIDPSPYFLAVANLRNEKANALDVQRLPPNVRIEFQQALGESLPLADSVVDLVTLQFVLHELPRDAAESVFRELVRVTRDRGCIAMVDNNPRSPVIQNLPPALFTLMKSTEPHSDDYYTFDVEACLRQIPGIERVQVTACDPRHRAILCRVRKST
jgi:SAM-dependent methyltransferase